MLHVEPTEVFVEDLNSRNGVVVNGGVVQKRCRLTHMDRIYVGAEELVLIDAAKITDQQETAPHVLCIACGAVNGAAKRHCGECGKRLQSSAGATYKDPPPRGSVRPATWDDPEETGTAQTRDVIGGIAAKAIIMGRYEEAERMLLPELHGLLERALRQQPLTRSKDDDPDTVFTTAVHHALELAKGLRKPQWIDWVFRVHIATGRLMSAQTIEALHDLVRIQEYKRREYAVRYVDAIQKQAHTYGRLERFLAQRVEGLSQVILARR